MSEYYKRLILTKPVLYNFIFAPLNHPYSGGLLLDPLVLAGSLALATVSLLLLSKIYKADQHQLNCHICVAPATPMS